MIREELIKKMADRISDELWIDKYIVEDNVKDQVMMLIESILCRELDSYSIVKGRIDILN